MSKSFENIFRDFDFRGETPGLFFNPNDLIAGSPLPHAHSVRRAWEQMELDAVLYLGRSPSAYFKQVDIITKDIARDLQRALWNHSVVPILVLASPKEVHVYSGWALPSRLDESPDDSHRLVAVLDRISQALEISQLIPKIVTGAIFDEKPESFNRKLAVDQYLLENLSAAGAGLSNVRGGLSIKAAHSLLMRILFASYLVEREMVGKGFSEQPLLSRIAEARNFRDAFINSTPPDAVDLLYGLFHYLKSIFNGSMFAFDLETEKQVLTDDHIRLLQSFLNGEHLGSKQLSLGFWAYDFRIIPIETISSIYQHFLEAEDGEDRRTTGAFYTPPHLAEYVLDVAAEDYSGGFLGKSILDPSCGSGIFLVGAFNRMADELESKTRHLDRLEKSKRMIDVLTNHIFGIDCNETACSIAAFSLYLALLDRLDPPDVHALEAVGQKLPVLVLSRQNRQETAGQHSIFEGNFFEGSLSLPRKEFDLIVGNPPWVSRGRSDDIEFLRWEKEHPDEPIPGHQIAHGFLWESLVRLAPNGTGCMVLPSAALLNETTASFQIAWLRKAHIAKVVNLSDLRFLLFPGARRPSMIMRFQKRKLGEEIRPIVYEVPKVDSESQRRGAIHIRPEDVSYIRPTEIIRFAEQKEPNLPWKIRFWGTSRDQRFLARLMDMPRLDEIAGPPSEGKRLIKGQGINASDREPSTEKQKLRLTRSKETPWWGPENLFLNANSGDIDTVIFEYDCERISDQYFKYIQHARNPVLFEPPLIIASQGATKVAFVDFPVLFRHALQSIKGDEKDRSLIIFLMVVMNSRLAEYFLFHTSSNVGTERTKTLFDELLRLPFYPPELGLDPERATSIMSEVVEGFDRLQKDLLGGDGWFGRGQRVQEFKRSVEHLVLDYYNVDANEKELIYDTVDVFKPSMTPTSHYRKVPTLSPSNQETREKYVHTLCQTLRDMSGYEAPPLIGSVTHSIGAGMAVVSLRKEKEGAFFVEKESSCELHEILKRVSDRLPSKTNAFVRHRGLVVFLPDAIHILKTLTIRDWTTTAALNDADQIAVAVLTSLGGK